MMELFDINSKVATSTEPAQHHFHEHEKCYSTNKDWIELAIIWVIVLCSLLGNSLVIYLFVSRRVSRYPAHCIITNLAIVDLLTALSLLVSDGIPGIYKPDGTGGLAKAFCIFFCSLYATWVFISASIFNLLLIAIERYISTLFPVTYRNRIRDDRTCLVVALVLAWIIPPFPVMYDIYFYTPEEDCCIITYNKEFITWAGTWALVGQLALPTLFMFYAYIHMTIVLHRLQARNDKARRRLILSCFSVSTFFFICWFPNQSVFFLHALQLPFCPVDLDTYYYKYANIIGYFTCALNPFLYAILNPSYRKALKKLKRRLLRKRPPPMSESENEITITQDGYESLS